jgi:hypothetical protein
MELVLEMNEPKAVAEAMKLNLTLQKIDLEGK